MKEYKVGEEFEWCEHTFITIEDKDGDCYKCAFLCHHRFCMRSNLRCKNKFWLWNNNRMSWEVDKLRSDNKNVIFVEKGK